MIRAAALAAIIAAPAPSVEAFDEVAFCESLARAVYNGAVDGLQMAPLIDGVEEALIGANAAGDLEAERAAASAYLIGYSSGLVYLDPAERAEEYFTLCVSEGV